MDDSLELGRVADDVDRRDPTSGYGEGDHDPRLIRRIDDNARASVYDDMLREGSEAWPGGLDLASDRLGAGHRWSGEDAHAAAIGSEDDIGVEDPQQALEVAGSSGGKERVDDRLLDSDIGVRVRRRALDSPSGAARELPSRRGRAVENLGDLVKRDREYVVEDEGQAFGGRELLEHDQQGDADGIGHD